MRRIHFIGLRTFLLGSVAVACSSTPSAGKVEPIDVTSEGITAGWHGPIHVDTGAGDRCLDVGDANTAPTAKVQIWDCDGLAQQNWTYDGAHLIAFDGQCLDVTGLNTTNTTPLQTYPCTGAWNQNWVYDANTTRFRLAPSVITSPKCLDARGPGANGAVAQIYDCGPQTNQAWLERPWSVSWPNGFASGFAAGPDRVDSVGGPPGRVHCSLYLTRPREDPIGVVTAGIVMSCDGVVLASRLKLGLFYSGITNAAPVNTKTTWDGFTTFSSALVTFPCVDGAYKAAGQYQVLALPGYSPSFASNVLQGPTVNITCAAHVLPPPPPPPPPSQCPPGFQFANGRCCDGVASQCSNACGQPINEGAYCGDEGYCAGGTCIGGGGDSDCEPGLVRCPDGACAYAGCCF